MSLAVAEAQKRFPSGQVTQMPHNNPGFDILVHLSDGSRRYIEVKGTTLAIARFFLSEGERRFSTDHAEVYSLWVFHSIDLEARLGVMVEKDGAVSDAAGVTLTPAQWIGVLG